MAYHMSPGRSLKSQQSLTTTSIQNIQHIIQQQQLLIPRRQQPTQQQPLILLQLQPPTPQQQRTPRPLHTQLQPTPQLTQQRLQISTR